MTSLFNWIKRHFTIWWIAGPIAAIGLIAHLTVALHHFAAANDPWYLVIFISFATLAALAIRSIYRTFSPLRR